MSSLSVVILTKNEENNIVDCLEKALFSDEVIVIDDYSTDRTLELINSFKNEKIKIFKRKLEGDFASQRNFALSKTKNEWILFIDADERLSEDLISEIKDKIDSGTKYRGFYLRRSDNMWGKIFRYGEINQTKLLRLARNGTGQWKNKVHEEWDINGKSGELNNKLIHYPHQSVREFLQEINFYTSVRAEELYKNGIKTNGLLILLYPFGKFFQNYILRLGFLDGIEGFIFAVLMSFHSFLVRGKLWLLWKKN